MAKKFADKAFCSWCGGDLKKINDNQLDCTQCGVAVYHNPLPTVGILPFNEHGELLLARAGQDPANGKLDTIGGFVDAGESAEQAAIREASEELGINLKQGDLCIVSTEVNDGYVLQEISYCNLDIFFEIRLQKDTTFTVGDDVASVAWYKPSEIDFDDFRGPDIANSVQSYLRSRNML